MLIDWLRTQLFLLTTYSTYPSVLFSKKIIYITHVALMDTFMMLSHLIYNFLIYKLKVLSFLKLYCSYLFTCIFPVKRMHLVGRHKAFFVLYVSVPSIGLCTQQPLLLIKIKWRNCLPFRPARENIEVISVYFSHNSPKRGV